MLQIKLLCISSVGLKLEEYCKYRNSLNHLFFFFLARTKNLCKPKLSLSIHPLRAGIRIFHDPF